MNEDLKGDVMLRVRAIHSMRKASKPLYMEAALFWLVTLALISLVDVPHVVLNLARVVEASGSASSFLSAAFSHALVSIKLVLVAETVVAAVLLKDVASRLTLRASRLA